MIYLSLLCYCQLHYWATGNSLKWRTLAADDAGNLQQHLHDTTALLCNECEDDCGGYLVEPVPTSVQVPVQSAEEVQETCDECNCNGRMGPCPLDGDWMKEKSCIYSCKVTRLDTGESETYTRLPEVTFKSRLYGHNSDFNNTDTKLSQHIWELKENNVPHETKWSILAKEPKFFSVWY